MKRFFPAFGLVFSLVFGSFAKEGIWVPILLEKYNLEEMKKMGFKLNASDIYDVNHSSMKDAVVLFGGGCTGELISGDGLLITNHHCGYGQIQKHSSVEKDYLTNGFWAMNRNEELSNPGLTVSFLEFMEDVTSKLLEGTEGLNENEGRIKTEKNREIIIKEASKGGKFNAQIKPLFNGNQHYLYVYKVYKDVRLVGAPPSAIGKFGGDTDNWMWPRHTGDFSLFRIYAGKDNQPADYSPENVPFKPKKFFPVSLKGVKEGDFTMVFGYPGTTTQYLSSFAVELILNQRDPNRIRIRDKKLEIINSDMAKDPKVRIQYSAKAAGISNAWKKWQGEMKGLIKNDAVNKKIEFENSFENWARQNSRWDNEYKSVLYNLENLHKQYDGYVKAADYYSEIVLRGVEIFSLASNIQQAANSIEKKQIKDFKTTRENWGKGIDVFYKDYNQSTDEKLFSELLDVLMKEIPSHFLPQNTIQALNKTGKDDWISKIYQKSVLVNQEKLKGILLNGSEKSILKLKNDPVVNLFSQLEAFYIKNIKPATDSLSLEIEKNQKKYMKGILEMKKDEVIYPDANQTLRVAYGKVEGYEPLDGVKYKYFTTLDGKIEKNNPQIYDYNVPAKLKELFTQKDYGRYAENGKMPVCFIASNHTTGGNSGSPVLNGNGELIGVNFDRCWEGTMSDILYDPEICRNISLDIRYVLFIVDKFAGAGYLLDEIEIRN